MKIKLEQIIHINNCEDEDKLKTLAMDLEYTTRVSLEDNIKSNESYYKNYLYCSGISVESTYNL